MVEVAESPPARARRCLGMACRMDVAAGACPGVASTEWQIADGGQACRRVHRLQG